MTCLTFNSGDWSSVTWSGCGGSVPTGTDDVFLIREPSNRG